MFEICSKLTIKTRDQRQWRRHAVFIVNFEQILHIALMFHVSSEHVNASWANFRAIHDNFIAVL